MKDKSALQLVASALLMLLFAACSTASNNDVNESLKNGQGLMMSPEMHEHMAKNHKKVAECLRSGKSQEECMPMMGKNGMGMMGRKGMGRGMYGMGMGMNMNMRMMKEDMMRDMDKCMSEMKGMKMDEKGMKKMRECMMQPESK